MDFFSRQIQAKRKTRLLVVYLVIAVMCIVSAINALVYSYMHFIHHQSYSLNEWLFQPKSLFVTVATVLMITTISFIQWRLLREGGDALALRMGASPVLLGTSDSSQRQLLNVVSEMAIASGVAMPNVYVMERERGINAFVAGLNQSDAILVVTQGAINELSRQELQGVIGHEFSHIFNSDMRINLQLISLLAGILFLSEAGRFVLSSMNDGGYRSGFRREGSANPFIFLLPMAIILFAVGSVGLFCARLIKSSISRQREYLADAAAVQYTRDNQGLASALYKISEFSEGSALQTHYAEEASHMCFSEPVSLFSGVLAGLLSTHPSVEQRIKAISPGWLPGRKPNLKASVRNGSVQSANTVPETFNAFAGQSLGKMRVASSVGQPTSQHLEEARRILQAIPDCLAFESGETDAKNHYMQVLLALLLSDDNQQIDDALVLIKDQYGNNFSSCVHNLAETIQQQPRKQRLAIIDLAVPALKQMNRKERKTLFEMLRTITQLDNTVSRFEFTLYWITKKHLYGAMNRTRPSIHNVQEVQNQVAIIIAMMIEAAGKDEIRRRKIFKSVMSSLGLGQMLMPVTEFDAEIIHEALQELALLSPIPKKSLLYALEDCITEDNVVDPEEMELFRAIAALLDCPVPPQLQTSDVSRR